MHEHDDRPTKLGDRLSPTADTKRWPHLHPASSRISARHATVCGDAQCAAHACRTDLDFTY